MHINVAIVEDDPRVREELANLIRRADGFACVGVYPDGETALADVPRRKPDVVLMDMKLPGMSGIECVRSLKMAYPSVQIIMLTVYDEVGQLFNSLMAGACGYLHETAAPSCGARSASFSPTSTRFHALCVASAEVGDGRITGSRPANSLR